MSAHSVNLHKKTVVFMQIIQYKLIMKNVVKHYTEEQKNSILNYYKNISSDYNRAYECLKNHCIPIPIKRNRLSEENNKKPH